jgi:hypothetical protein
VINSAQTPSRRASTIINNYSEAFHVRSVAAFGSSTKVRIFPCDRHNSDRHGGIVLGFNPHLDNSACGRLVQQPNHCALLLWGDLTHGVVAVPIMTVMMVVVTRLSVMGRFSAQP